MSETTTPATPTIKVNLELPLSDKACQDLLTTCVEGGSAYWLACQSIERTPELDVTKIVGCFDRDDDDTKWGDADVETIRKGITKILNREVKVNSTTYSNILSVATNYENADYDADDADAALQAGLLGGIVYG